MSNYKWEKSDRKEGGICVTKKDCDAWVYPKSGGYVGNFILIPNIEGSLTQDFPNEVQAKDWCELLVGINTKEKS